MPLDGGRAGPGAGVDSPAMLPVACLKHWYDSAIFFGPVLIVAVWVMLMGRRRAAEADRRDEGVSPQIAER